MLVELLSKIALSETFRYGLVGRLYVGSGWHIFDEGDILVEKESRDFIEVVNYSNELLRDSMNFILPCSVGMYRIKKGEIIEDLSKVEIETNYRKIKLS